MSIIRQVCRGSRYAPFSIIDTIPWLFHNIIASNMLKVDRNSLDVAVLEKRLTEAERRISLLFHEISDIKAKLALIKPPNSAPLVIQIDPVASTSGVKRNATSNNLTSESKKSKHEFTMEGDHLVAYVDGACENNGRAGARAGIGVWFGDNHPLNVSEPVVGRPTNNTAEIQACIAAAETAKAHGHDKIKLVTDSEFVVNSMTQWIHKWKQNDWKVASGGEVKNKNDFMKLDQTLGTMQDVQWEHVRGHSGVRGNEGADRLARAGAQRYRKY